MRRLVIIPFNATFTKEDPDHDPFIKYKLVKQGSVEYLIKLGLDGLRRVLENQGFISSEKVDRQLEEYEEENNPIVAFIHDQERGEADIINETTEDVYARYKVFYNAANMIPVSKNVFAKQINKRLKTESYSQKIPGSRKVIKIFRKI